MWGTIHTLDEDRLDRGDRTIRLLKKHTAPGRVGNTGVRAYTGANVSSWGCPGPEGDRRASYLSPLP